MVFSLHDIAWLFETHFVPQVWANNLSLPPMTLTEYVTHYSKNIINISISGVILLKYRLINFNYDFSLGLFIITIYHAINIFYQLNFYIINGYALIVMYIIDCLPYLLLLKKR